MDRLSSGMFVGGEGGVWQRSSTRPSRSRLPAVVVVLIVTRRAFSHAGREESAQGLDESVVRVPPGRTGRIELPRERT